MKRRQKIRKALILISFLFFPITIYYLSPAIIIRSAAKGIINGSFIAFALLFLSALILGRGYCGWVCPGAGLSEACFPVRKKKAPGGRWDWIKYLIWVPWIGIIIYFAVKAGGYHAIDPFWGTHHGVSLSDLTSYIVYYVVVGLIVVLALVTGKRGFCHYVCWMAPFMVIGLWIRNRFNWPALHLEADESRCTDCQTCSTNCPMSLDVNGLVRRGAMHHSECILCGTCVDQCPADVIQYAWRQKRNVDN